MFQNCTKTQVKFTAEVVNKVGERFIILVEMTGEVVKLNDNI